MVDATERVVQTVRTLDDLSLAALLCLVAEQHAIIEADAVQLDTLAEELRRMAGAVFGLASTVLECSEETTPDAFGAGLLIKEETASCSNSTYAVSQGPCPRSPLQPVMRMADVVIAKHLNLSPCQLVRERRIFTRTAIHPAPKRFLFIALLAAGAGSDLMPLLNDEFFISHYHHGGNESLPGLQTEYADSDNDPASHSSVVQPPKAIGRPPLLTDDDLAHMAKLTSHVRMSSEVVAYMSNLIVSLRLHRAVSGGISALASRHFKLLIRALAPLHGLDYVPPSLVSLAARKVYPHRISLSTAEDERSMQWGSSLEAVRESLNGVTVHDIIEDTLEKVDAPL